MASDTAYHKIRTERAPAPEGCPIDHTFSPFTDTYVENPYAELAKRREESPIFYSEELGYLVVTRMKDVAEVFTNTPGKYVPLAETIRGFNGIVAGDYDHIPEQAFAYCGGIDEAVENAKKYQ